jgi:hypothetical protein
MTHPEFTLHDLLRNFPTVFPRRCVNKGKRKGRSSRKDSGRWTLAFWIGGGVAGKHLRFFYEPVLTLQRAAILEANRTQRCSSPSDEPLFRSSRPRSTSKVP